MPVEKLGRKIADMEKEMYAAAQNLEFEKAARLRDALQKLKEEGLISAA